MYNVVNFKTICYKQIASSNIIQSILNSKLMRRSRPYTANFKKIEQ